MNIFRYAICAVSIEVFMIVIWICFLPNINVNDQSVFTLVNGITASTSVIIGFSGAIIGIMLHEAKEKQDHKTRMFFLIAITVLMAPLTMLWTTYVMLTVGGVWISIAVKCGLSGLITALYVFTIVVIFIAEQLGVEIEKKSL
jgi:membrane associated rhomboid family serine protease